MLGEADELDIAFLFRRIVHAARALKLFECLARVSGAEIAGNGVFQLSCGDASAPEAQGLRHGNRIAADKDIGLEAFYGGGAAGQRKADIGKYVGAKREDDAVYQLRHADAEQRRRLQRRDAHRTVGDQCGNRRRGGFKRWQQQSVDPQRNAGQKTCHGSARIAAAPEQSAKECRSNLRDGCEGQQADGGKGRVT